MSNEYDKEGLIKSTSLMTPADIPFKQKKNMMWGLTLGNYLSASLSTAMVAFYADFAQ